MASSVIVCTSLVCNNTENPYFFPDKIIFKREFYANFLLTHSVAVTTKELEMTDFPPLKLTETSRVLKENEETLKNKLKTRGVLWKIQSQPESLLKKSKLLIRYPSGFLS